MNCEYPAELPFHFWFWSGVASLPTIMLRMFENRALSRIFGPKMVEVRGERRRLHNEVFNELYFSPNVIRVIISRRMRWAGHVASMGERRGAYRVLVGKPEGKRPLGRPGRRLKDNIKMDLQKGGWRHGLDWSCWGQGQVATGNL